MNPTKSLTRIASSVALSERTRKFVMEITSGATPEEAIKTAGLPPNSAPELLNNPAIKREIDIALGVQGIDETYFAGKLKDLCEAEDGKGNPVWSARAKGLELVKELLSYAPPKNTGETKTTYTYEERLLMIANEEAPATVRIIEGV